MRASSLRHAVRALLAAGALTMASAGLAQVSSRGELLYSTHCLDCHTSQMHWRDRRQARDWATLKAQVRHWQQEARLRWSEDDVNAVARHLNDTIYRFPQSQAARKGQSAQR